MRTEVKAGIVIGLVVITATIIWSATTRDGAVGGASKVPFDRSRAEEDRRGNDLALAGHEAGDRSRSSPSASTDFRPDLSSYDEPIATQNPPDEVNLARSAASPSEPSSIARDSVRTLGEAGGASDRAGSTSNLDEPLVPVDLSRDLGAAGLIPQDPSAEGRSGDESGRDAAATPTVLPPWDESRSGRLDAAKTAPSHDDPGAGGSATRRMDPGATTYVIEPADRLILIARRHYGDGRMWTKIVEANPGLDPNRLREGARIILPAKDAVAAGAPDGNMTRRSRKAGASAGPTTYVVGSGDTLISIARDILHDEARWQEIYELNKHQLRSPDVIHEGTKLVLPPVKDQG